MRRWLWILSFCLTATGCSKDKTAPPPTGTGGGGNGGAGGSSGLSCPDNGVLHGPWALQFTETTAVVRWDACAPSSTEIAVEPEEGGAPTLHQGEQSAADVTTSYDIVNGVPPDLPGVYYRTEVAIDGLEPGRCYRYQLDADPSRQGRFCTARPAGDGFKFFAVGDTNPAVGDTTGVLDHMPSDVDFAIHLGDIQYYASVFDSWAAWFPAMQPLLRQGAFMPSIGNHEYEIDFEFQDYYERLFGGAGFDSPRVEWYRFQSGGVWFFSLSTEADLKAGSDQANWLEAQLADAASQPGYRFGVVYFHKPMMTLSEYTQKKGEREHFDPIFRQHGVRLVMCGHVHGYERFDDGSLTYIVSGGGGASLHDLDVSIDERPEEAGKRQAASANYHGTIIEVGNDSIHGTAISHTGDTLDDFTISLTSGGGGAGGGGAASGGGGGAGGAG
jgi:Calcineurin-like phosphoesterase